MRPRRGTDPDAHAGESDSEAEPNFNTLLAQHRAHQERLAREQEAPESDDEDERKLDALLAQRRAHQERPAREPEAPMATESDDEDERKLGAPIDQHQIRAGLIDQYDARDEWVDHQAAPDWMVDDPNSEEGIVERAVHGYGADGVLLSALALRLGKTVGELRGLIFDTVRKETAMLAVAFHTDREGEDGSDLRLTHNLFKGMEKRYYGAMGPKTDPSQDTKSGGAFDDWPEPET